MLLRLSALLLLVGVVLSIVAGVFHPDRAIPNDHAAAFAEYAADASWTAVHLGQFVGMAILITGLVVLVYALNLEIGAALWLGRFGVGAAVVALGLYAVLQAVDGVALKQAVDAWARAPEAEKLARFASAETVRWLEWATRSYQSFVLGAALLLLAAAIVAAARPAKAVGYLMGLSGFAYLAQGWVLGSQGFSDANTIPTLLGYISMIIWSIWLLVVAWRMQAAPSAPTLNRRSVGNY
jgi:hypothetical protein